MKPYLTILFFTILCEAYAQQTQQTKNLFIITIDGVRWQEIFNGADSVLINNSNFTIDTSLVIQMFWDESISARRKKLTPFFWNVIEKKGQLYGNRNYNNKVNVANFYKFSYPGYNEIFTGFADMAIKSNKPVQNKNTNFLEFLNNKPFFKNKVVAFTSWSVFPHILGVKRNALPVFSGYTSLPDSNTNEVVQLINKLQNSITIDKMETRYDELTFLAATTYIQQHQPKIVFISLGEPDESAHRGEYDNYLQQINNADRMISQLWYFIQSNIIYKNTTTLLITTDHGRGKKNKAWQNHDFIIKGSGHTWLAVMGPDISPFGEIKKQQQIYQKQIAGTLTSLLGFTFLAEHPIAEVIDFNLNSK